MITNLKQSSNILKLFAALWLFSSSDAVPTSASRLFDVVSYTDVVRQDMHNIAYLYANHWWSACQDNRQEHRSLHKPTIHLPRQ